VGYLHAKIINVLESSNRKVRVDVLERNDGLFEFRVYAERFEEFTEEFYWSPTLESGIYASVEDAERDALNEVLASDTKFKSGH
jgi:hypothetical protein